MAKVIRAFKERYHDMKRYNAGDEYPEDDKERVKFLVESGFLAKPVKPKRKKGVDADANTHA